jgi:hypothetical protein
MGLHSARFLPSALLFQTISEGDQISWPYKTMNKIMLPFWYYFGKINTCLEELTFNPLYLILATLVTHYELAKELFSCSFYPST